MKKQVSWKVRGFFSWFICVGVKFLAIVFVESIIQLYVTYNVASIDPPES